MRCPGSLLSIPNESLPKFSLFSYYSEHHEKLRNTSHFLLYSEKERSYVDLLSIGADARVRLYCLCEKPAQVKQLKDSLLKRRQKAENVKDRFIVTNYVTTWSFDYLTNTVWVLSDSDIWYQLNSQPFDEYKEIWRDSEKCTSIWFQLYRIIENDATEEFSKLEDQLVKYKNKKNKVKKLLKRVASQLTWDRLVRQLDEDPDAMRDKENTIKLNAPIFKTWMHKQTILIVAEDPEETEFQFFFKHTDFFKTLKQYAKQQKKEESTPSTKKRASPVSSTNSKKRGKKSTTQKEASAETASKAKVVLKLKKSSTSDSAKRKRKSDTSNGTAKRKRRKRAIDDDSITESIIYDEEPEKLPSDGPQTRSAVVNQSNRKVVLDDDDDEDEDDEEEYLQRTKRSTKKRLDRIPKKSSRSKEKHISGIPASRFEDLSVFNQCSLCDKFAVEFVTCTRFNAEDKSCVYQCCRNCITGAQWKHWTRQDFVCPSCKLRR